MFFCGGSRLHGAVNGRVAVSAVRTLMAFLIAMICVGTNVDAQESDPGKEVAERLKKGVDNPDSADNKYRGGAGSLQEVIQNMKDFAKTIWKDVPDQTLDKWYSPHLPDILFPPDVRLEQAKYRSKAGVSTYAPCKYGIRCLNGDGEAHTACPGPCQNPACNVLWDHQEHLALECCIPGNNGTKVYKDLINDSNYKTCCVRDGTKPGDINETLMVEERIACRHRDGSGWAGMFEYYYPTTIFGLENQRGETMLATKQEVEKCIEESDAMMESAETSDFVTESIMSAQKVAGQSAEGNLNSDQQKVRTQVQQDIKKVRPTDKKLQFTDSLSGGGITVRPFLPAYDRLGMTILARHFCMRDEQFHKLLHPLRDKLQLPGTGGTGPVQLAATIPIWANYCPEGVTLMTEASNSEIRNVDETDTRYMLGMQAWKKDPLYCQNMHRQNPNMRETKITDVLEKSGGGADLSDAAVGYTCIGGESNLDTALVPQGLYKRAPVERRTAIVDRGLGFLIAGGLFPPKWLAPGTVPGSFRSMYKRFEMQPYSMTAAQGYQTFWGKKFTGTFPMNEVKTPCTRLTGRNYNTNGMPGNQGNSDQLFLSDKTHESFTQTPIVNAQGKRGAFDREVPDWSKGDDESKAKIKERKLDKDAHNYGVTFRIFRTCPEGYSRWRPTDPHGALAENLNTFCGEENFGSPRAH